MRDVKTRIDALHDGLRQLNNATGVAVDILQHPTAPVFSTERKVVAEDRTVDTGEQRYDVVAIGGWSMTVEGANDGGVGVETVNSSFGDVNHVFASNLTAAEVRAGSWSWGRGTTQTHFAIAAVPHGADRAKWPTSFAPVWWNNLIPASDIAARAVAENTTGGPITLRLTIGNIG
jgi:hypothetical protein